MTYCTINDSCLSAVGKQRAKERWLLNCQGLHDSLLNRPVVPFATCLPVISSINWAIANFVKSPELICIIQHKRWVQEINQTYLIVTWWCFLPFSVTFLQGETETTNLRYCDKISRGMSSNRTDQEQDSASWSILWWIIRHSRWHWHPFGEAVRVL